MHAAHKQGHGYAQWPMMAGQCPRQSDRSIGTVIGHRPCTDVDERPFCVNCDCEGREGGRKGRETERGIQQRDRCADGRLGAPRGAWTEGRSTRRISQTPQPPALSTLTHTHVDNRLDRTAPSPPLRLTNSQPRIPLASRTHVPPAIPDRHLKPRWGRCQSVVTVVHSSQALCSRPQPPPPSIPPTLPSPSIPPPRSHPQRRRHSCGGGGSGGG